MTVLETLNARVSGVSTCVATQTAAPVMMRALNDVSPKQENAPMIFVTQVGTGIHVIPQEGIEREPNPPPVPIMYRTVGALIGHILPEREDGMPVVVEPPVTLPPETTNVVAKWPDDREIEERTHGHPLADHLRLRDLNASPQ